MEKNKITEFYSRFSEPEFIETNYYQGNDLGSVWTKEETRFRVWAPTAEQVTVYLYRSGELGDCFLNLSMSKDRKGTWLAAVEGDWNGTYYTYGVTVDGETKEAVDPYAKAVGVNGNRGMVIDLLATNPEGFTLEQKPFFAQAADAIIYELHVRDFSSDQSSGIRNKGKYLAFTEKGTTNYHGDRTGVDYLKKLGITHIHLLPSFDFMTVDETRLSEEQYNWGYDPQNYNVPEGSYSTDPYNGKVRVREFKQMVQSLHQNGLRVIMDVVYNHTMESNESNFNRIVPGYYYRLTQDGSFSNASGCGNETASERLMMRKFMVDSVVYWAKEYHIDGFRFDLMGIHDIQTMNEIRQALNEVDPSILVYGEGWTGGMSPLPEWKRALKDNVKNMNPGIAAFNDNLRDAVKGSVFHNSDRGFVSGRDGLEESIEFGVAGSIWNEGVDYGRVLYTNSPWAVEPTQTINYTSAHDNLTLWDKLSLSNPDDSRENRIRMNLLAAAIILTSQGIPFFQAGEEFLRSKPLNEEGTAFDENSYRSPDAVNSLKWNDTTTNKEVINYYKGLIAFRKAHSALRMSKAEDVRMKLKLMDWSQPNVVTFTIVNDIDGMLCVIYNANREARTVHIPEGEWKVYVKGNQAGTEVIEFIVGEEVSVEAISAMVLIK
ncbi:MAG: pullulanase, type [Herbinix sp.]|jgi:pullulanase|nr:pullulanase, type [Herbinix sp.]